MKTTATRHPQSLRFRRWSRAGYAVFRSLGCQVTIGRLEVAISDKSLQKMESLSLGMRNGSCSESGSGETLREQQEMEAELLQRHESLLFETNREATAAADWSPKYILIPSGCDERDSLQPLFYF